MPYVNVPNDLSKIKTKIAFNLTKRQLICFGGAGAVGIPAYLLAKSAIGSTGAMFVMLALMLPAFFLAMYERDGLPFEKVVRNIVRVKITRPGIRPYKTQNIYAPFTGREEPVKLVTEMLGAPQRETVKEEPVAENKPKAKSGKEPGPR